MKLKYLNPCYSSPKSRENTAKINLATTLDHHSNRRNANGLTLDMGDIRVISDESSSSDTSAGQRFPPHNRTLGVRE